MIPYVTANWNVTSGCTPISPGCLNCWAAATAKRFPKAHAGYYPPDHAGGNTPDDMPPPVPFSQITIHPERLDAPLHWRRPRVVGVCMIGDLFHESAIHNRTLGRKPCAPRGSLHYQMWSVMSQSPHHAFLVLTKRAQAMYDILDWWAWAEVGNPGSGDYIGPQRGPLRRIRTAGQWQDRAESIARSGWQWPLPNVWLGVTVCNQEEADEKIPLLLATPAAHRWASYEPALGPVDFGYYLEDPVIRSITPKRTLLDAIVGGCESGAGRRPAPHAWFEFVKERCRVARKPFYLKQQAENEDGTGKVIHFAPRR